MIDRIPQDGELIFQRSEGVSVDGDPGMFQPRVRDLDPDQPAAEVLQVQAQAGKSFLRRQRGCAVQCRLLEQALGRVEPLGKPGPEARPVAFARKGVDQAARRAGGVDQAPVAEEKGDRLGLGPRRRGPGRTPPHAHPLRQGQSDEDRGDPRRKGQPNRDAIRHAPPAASCPASVIAACALRNG